MTEQLQLFLDARFRRTACESRYLVLVAIGCVTFGSARGVRAQADEPAPPVGSHATGESGATEQPRTDDASATVGSARILQVTLGAGSFRVDAAVASPEVALTGTSLGEPSVSPIALGSSALDPGYHQRGAVTLGVLAEASLGVGARVDLGVRVCALSCGPAPVLFGLSSRVRLFASDRAALGLRLQASTFGSRLTAGTLGLTWLRLRGHLLVGLLPEISFRAQDVDGSTPRQTIVGAMAPLALAYAHPRFRVGGHVGGGFMAIEGNWSAVIPIGLDGSALLLARRVRLEAWLSFGAAVVVGYRDDVHARGAMGIRLGSNP